ncbi:putative leader peptide [Streptomyces sp. NPDC049813]|uniref:putative leader peptide n=1 Tax=Streptomyces sp. NPDC049813 TaxID=3365597 RepID=UPI0037B6D259
MRHEPDCPPRGPRSPAPRRRARCPRALAPRRRVRLHTRPYVDLRRVAGALCRR